MDKDEEIVIIDNLPPGHYLELPIDVTYHAGVKCPKCGTWHSIEHLRQNKYVPVISWYCNNEDCGEQFQFFISWNNDKIMDLHLNGKRSVSTRSVLKLKDDVKDLRVIIKSVGYPDDHKRYYYEEGTCPCNIMREVVEVFEGEDGDPHGIFEYVKDIPKKKDECNDYTIEDVV